MVRTVLLDLPLALLLAAPTALGAQQQFLPGGKAHLPPDMDTTAVVASADVDGDGDQDLLIGNDGQNRLYLNDGFGVFVDATSRLPFDSDTTLAITTGDVDGDGDVDFLAGNSTWPGGQADKLYRNDGTGNFAVILLPGGASRTSDLALGDVDGDSDLDLVATDPGAILSGGRNRLYLNDGTGMFTDVTSAQTPLAFDFTNAVTLGDVDGDSDLDILFGNAPGGEFPVPGQTRLLLNDGTGNFTDATSTHLPTDRAYTVDAVLIDTDGDSDLDIVLAENDAPGARLKQYVNDGNGRFADVSTARMPSVPESPVALAVGDVDGDSDLDLATGHRGWNGSSNVGAQDRLWLNDGAGSFAAATAGTMPVRFDTTTALAFVDVDGTGGTDLVTGNTRQTNTLALNDGRGRLQDASRVAITPDNNLATSLAVGDLNGDGTPDAVVGTWAREESRLLLNDGRGELADVTATSLPGRADLTAAVGIFDADGDGDLDVALGNSGPNVWYRNDGSGRFVVGAGFGGSWQTNALAFGDVDGDGDQDIATATGSVFPFSSRQDRLYINLGTGWFVDRSAQRMPPDADYSTAVLFGDVDGDSDLDLVFGTQTRDRLYLNDGTGRFTDATAQRLPAGAAGSTALALADVDADGDDDLLLGGFGFARMYANDGAGRFTDVTAGRLPPVSGWVRGFAVGDVDGDGDLDVVVATGGFPAPADQQNLLLTNDGTGRFTDATAQGLPVRLDRSSGVALVDLDRDGDRDLLFANYAQQNQLFVNLERQLRFPWLARPGRPFQITVHGRRHPIPATQLAVILLSARAAPPVLVPPFGAFGLDPAATILLPTVALSASGEFATTFGFPNVPGISGATLYAQALVFHGPRVVDGRLTNVVAERIGR